jgi:hypothetical protein
MAMERRGSKRFFYSSRRVRGRVKKTYYGRGIVGSIAAYLFQSRQDNVKGWREFRRRLLELTAELRAFNTAVQTLFEATLYIAGCDRPSRHRWRLRADWQASGHRVIRLPTLPDLEDISESAVVVTALQMLVAKARRGELAAAVEMAKLLEQSPSIWQVYLAEADKLQQAWGILLAAKNPSAIESCWQQAQAVCNWRPGPDSSVLTELLARCLVVNFLALRFAEFAVGDTLDWQQATFLRKVQGQFRELTKRSIFDVTEWRRLLPRLMPRSQSCPAGLLPDGF